MGDPSFVLDGYDFAEGIIVSCVTSLDSCALFHMTSNKYWFNL